MLLGVHTFYVHTLQRNTQTIRISFMYDISTYSYAGSQIIETLDGVAPIWNRKPAVLHKKPHQAGQTI